MVGGGEEDRGMGAQKYINNPLLAGKYILWWERRGVVEGRGRERGGGGREGKGEGVSRSIKVTAFSDSTRREGKNKINVIIRNKKEIDKSEIALLLTLVITK